MITASRLSHWLERVPAAAQPCWEFINSSLEQWLGRAATKSAAKILRRLIRLGPGSYQGGQLLSR
jgi:hypothetical protein